MSDRPGRQRVEPSTVVMIVAFWLFAVMSVAFAGCILVNQSFDITRDLNDVAGARFTVPVYLVVGFLLVVGGFFVRLGFVSLGAMRARLAEAERTRSP